MLKLGITGGIGSGKSTVCKIFKSLQVPVYHADDRAKELVYTDEVLRNDIISEFGEKAFTHSTYNREYIASVVFGDKDKLEILNQIIHPRVEKDFEDWYRKQKSNYVVHEAAILFESGVYKQMDYTLFIDAPVNYRIERVMKRDEITEEQVRVRLNNQWPADKISELADWVIVNDGKTLILPQILEIHNYLTGIEKSHG